MCRRFKVIDRRQPSHEQEFSIRLRLARQTPRDFAKPQRIEWLLLVVIGSSVGAEWAMTQYDLPTPEPVGTLGLWLEELFELGALDRSGFVPVGQAELQIQRCGAGFAEVAGG